jgi:hypothetical protein
MQSDSARAERILSAVGGSAQFPRNLAEKWEVGWYECVRGPRGHFRVGGGGQHHATPGNKRENHESFSALCRRARERSCRVVVSYRVVMKRDCFPRIPIGGRRFSANGWRRRELDAAVVREADVRVRRVGG